MADKKNPQAVQSFSTESSPSSSAPVKRRLFDRMEETILRLSTLRTVTEIQSFIVHEVARLLDADEVLLVYEQEFGRRVAASCCAQNENADLILPHLIAGFDRLHSTQTTQLYTPVEDPERSWLIAPLIAQNKITGYLCASSLARQRLFAQEEIDTLSILALQVAGAIEHARWDHFLQEKITTTTTELNDRVEELAILHSIGYAMQQNLDINTITRIVGDKMIEIFNSDTATIFLLDPQTNLVSLPYAFDKREGGYLHIEPIPLGKGLTSQVIKSRSPLIFGTAMDQITHGGYIPPELEERILSTGIANSWLGVPIIANDEVLGVVHLGDYKPHSFNDDHIRLLQILSSNLGVVMANARLYTVAQQRVKELEIISGIQRGLASTLDFQSSVDLVGDKVREIYQNCDFTIAWFDQKNHLVHWLYAYDQGQRVNFPSEQPIPDGSFIRMINDHQPQIWNTAQEGDDIAGPPIPGSRASKSGIRIPIICNEKVLGAFSLEDPEHEYAFDEAQIRLLTAINGSLGVALENSRLFNETQRLLEETEQRNQELASITTIQEILVSKLDFQSIFDLVGDKIREMLHSPDLAITWYDEKNNLNHFIYNYEHGIRLSIPSMPPKPDGALVRMRKSPDPILWNTEEEGDRLIGKPLPGTDASKSGFAVPIVNNDRVIGVINVENYEHEYAFNTADIRLLSTVAASLGAALENALLFDETQLLLKETEQRNTELAIINGIQLGLASKLDFQAILDLVGDKLREVFNTPDLSIGWYDERANLLHRPYTYEHGKRIIIQPEPPVPGGGMERLIKTHQPVIYNTEQEGLQLGGPIEGTDTSKSGMIIPIISSDRVIGLITIENFVQEYAYSESDVRLVSTIAASLGAALENAHLFNETQRLLKETGQRNAELATVNTIARELSSELDAQSLIHLIGEQIRNIFWADIAYVALLDESTNMISFPYSYGEYHYPISIEQGLTGKILRTGLPLRLTQDDNPNKKPPAKNGPKEALSYLGVPIFVGGKPVGVISVQSTELPAAYDANDEHLLNTLAVYVGTALQNARLYNEAQEARAAAEKANKAKSSFLANMSHELRTPLNAILGFSQILENDPSLTPRQAEQVRTINQSGSHLLKLINDVLDMSKIEANQITLSPSTFCLTDMITDLEKIFHPLTNAKNIQLVVEQDESLPRYVTADERKLRQVIINLVGNAIKFTDTGGVAMRARAEPARSEMDPEITKTMRLRVEVEDSGPGIAPEDVDKIFESFQQSDAGEISGGTGLGLTISKRFVELMGGHISVTSQLNKGSCFRFDVLVELAEAVEQPEKPAERRIIGLKAGSSPRRILVVDDVRTNRTLILQLLEPFGLEIREAENGQQALEIFDQWTPDLVIMDMRMPIMDGYEATRRIRSNPAGASICILGVTASAFEEDGEKIMASGVNTYIRKPFRPEELLHTLGKCLNLEYIYAEEQPAASPTPAQIDKKALQALPDDLIFAIRQAVTDGDIGLLAQVIGEVRQLNQTLAVGLKDLADKYEYESLLELLDEREGAHGHST